MPKVNVDFTVLIPVATDPQCDLPHRLAREAPQLDIAIRGRGDVDLEDAVETRREVIVGPVPGAALLAITHDLLLRADDSANWDAIARATRATVRQPDPDDLEAEDDTAANDAPLLFGTPLTHGFRCTDAR